MAVTLVLSPYRGAGSGNPDPAVSSPFCDQPPLVSLSGSPPALPAEFGMTHVLLPLSPARTPRNPSPTSSPGVGRVPGVTRTGGTSFVTYFPPVRIRRRHACPGYSDQEEPKP